MKIKSSNLWHLCTLIFVFFSINIFAQKLPHVQINSIHLPANLKIDGKSTEWNNQFQAYDHAVDIFYTVANNDSTLYFIIQAIDPIIIKKILNGGITVSINTLGEKKLKGSASVTFPVFERNKRLIVNFKNKPQIIPGSVNSEKLADSFMYVNNRKMNELSKMIRTSGIKSIDTLISVYNEDEIKASALFDNKMIYTYELSISLKHLGILIDHASKFAYNIKINEMQSQGVSIKTATNGEPTNIVIHPGATAGQSATDFWGKYTLAKK